MPSITLYLTPDDQALLATVSQASGLSPKRLGERILRRELLKAAARPRQANRDLGLERATRQATVLRHLEQIGGVANLDREAKRALATRLGVTERTLYRDLEVAEAVLRREQAEAVEGAAADV